MILLFDIGNTHTHLGLGNSQRVLRRLDISTECWFSGQAPAKVIDFTRRYRIEGAALCSVVPQCPSHVQKFLQDQWGISAVEVGPNTVRELRFDYPKPATIGPDRIANASAALHFYGAPVITVGFGTATIFDVVDHRGCFVGGAIAPGISAFSDYLHEKTALLPRIRFSDPKTAIGKNTEHAMTVGIVRGFQGMVTRVIEDIAAELETQIIKDKPTCKPRIRVVATGGYARWVTRLAPLFTDIAPNLTLEGVRLVALNQG